MRLPPSGCSAESIRDELERLAAGDVDWKAGRAFSLAYFAGQDVLDVATEANARFLSTNALNVAAFPSLKTLQADVVAMVAGLVSGGPEVAGVVTAGGTESILLAVKAARNRGREERGIESPEMILPATAHAAFEKAAHDYGVKSVRVPVDGGFRADPTAMRAAVTRNTVLLVASAPSYPQGVIDPVGEVAAIALDAAASCHVDACMGGITLPMLERLGRPIPPFDFRVAGVTSVSIDLHKYGYAAKGAGVLLHRTRELRKHHTFATRNWLGGLYGSAGILGTRGGGPIAAAWAVLRYLGEDGYLRLTEQARAATEALAAGLRAAGARILAEPEATLLAFTFDDADPFAVGDALWRRGWLVDQQSPPASLHCTVSAAHVKVVPQFLRAVADALAEVRAQGARADQKAYGAFE